MMHERNYTIIIDEVINIFENVNISMGDLNLLVKAEIFKKTNLDAAGDVSMYSLDKTHPYTGQQLRGLICRIGKQPIIQIREQGARKNAKVEFYTRQWVLPKEIFEVSEEIYILTYLYDGTPLSSFLEISNVPVDYWCITNGPYGLTFGPSDPVIPEYIHTIREKLHICNNAPRNKIGDRENALSVKWYQRARKPKDKKQLNELRRNIRWFMRGNKEIPKFSENKRMWASYKEGIPFLQDKGFTNADVVFNKRASNDYRNRRVLAYCVNVYAKPGLIKYCNAYGVTYNENIYALSTLVQWIWRSAIRDGQEVWLYLPSSRMRKLLTDWLDEVEHGIISGYQKHHHS